jgi:acyl dehydratase
VGEVRTRFSSPVFPGDTLGVRYWRTADGAVYQCLAGGRIVMVELHDSACGVHILERPALTWGAVAAQRQGYRATMTGVPRLRKTSTSEVIISP